MIDPVLSDLPLYLGVLDEMGWKLDLVLETHLHEEHITASGALRAATGALVGSGDARMVGADRLFLSGEQLDLGSLTIDVLATPGHTPCCLSYRCGDRLFTGDCLLIGDCGNLCGQGADAGRLFDSITRKLLSFADETLLYPGHDQKGRQVSCIGEERRNNPLFGGVSRDEFIARMAARPCAVSGVTEDIVARNCACGIEVSKSS